MSHHTWNTNINRRWFDIRNSGKSIVLIADESFFDSIAQETSIELGGKSASEHFVESVRTEGEWQRHPLSKNEMPSTSAYIALAILAATHMDSGSQQGMTSYWQPFKTIYRGIADNNQIPRELKPIWQGLWHDIEKWANVTNAGKYGIVRFPDRSQYGNRDPHKNIRHPKSQSLLKLEDLTRLTMWFNRLDLNPDDLISRSWLAEQIRETVGSDEAFSTHARRVFRDDLRFESAVNQVLSYHSRWNGEVWNPTTKSSKQKIRSRLIFALRQGELAIGIQERRDAEWKLASTASCFPVLSGAAAASKHRKTINPLAAVWCNETRAFIQTKSIAANDRFLFFFKPPAYLHGGDVKTNYLSSLLEDLRKVSNDVTAFTPVSTGSPGTHWKHISNLDQRWVAFQGVASAPINEENISHRLKGFFAADISKLRLIEVLLGFLWVAKARISRAILKELQFSRKKAAVG